LHQQEFQTSFYIMGLTMVTCLIGFMGILGFMGTITLSNRPWYSSLFTFHSERSEVTVPGTYKRRTEAVEDIMSLFTAFSLHFDFCNLDFLAIFENIFRLVANNRKFRVLQTTDNQEVDFYG